MKKGVLYFSITVLLASSMYMAYFYAMEAGMKSSGKEEMEEVPVKGKGKRPTEEQPEGETEIKKVKSGVGVSSHTKFITKDIIKPKRVLNSVTGEYDIKNEIVDRIIINNEDHPELFTGTTFEELIKERTEQGLYYIIAVVKSEVNFVQKIDYYDAFQYMTYVFGSDFTSATKNRYNEKLETFRGHPVSKSPMLGTIDFYYITDINDSAFIYFGSDFDLHWNPNQNPGHVDERREFVQDLFKANIPNEMIGEDEVELDTRAAYQVKLGAYLYKSNNQKAAYHYFELAETKQMHPEMSDARCFMALRYYKQGKYEEALAQIKVLAKNFYPSLFLRSTQFSSTLSETVSQWYAVQGLIYYHTKNYEKAWEYLKKISNPSDEVKSLLKTIGEHRIQGEWQRIEKEEETR